LRVGCRLTDALEDEHEALSRPMQVHAPPPHSHSLTHSLSRSPPPVRPQVASPSPPANGAPPPSRNGNRERDFFIDNLLVRIYYIIEMIEWTGLAPWEF